VENAIKHGVRRKREGGRVAVRAKVQENSVLFSVEDNGVGYRTML
jgi:sensor histidine kinase YesM